MNNKLVLSLTALILASVFTLAPQSAYGKNCSDEKVKLTIKKHLLKLIPSKKPICLNVTSVGKIDSSFTIEFKRGSIPLEDGQVTVKQVYDKRAGCADAGTLTLGGKLTNSGNQTMTILVTGDDVDDNDTVCFDIDVRDIGMIDPRARVVRNNSISMVVIAEEEMSALINAYELLLDSDIGATLAVLSYEEILQNDFEISEEEAIEFVRQYQSQSE